MPRQRAWDENDDEDFDDEPEYGDDDDAELVSCPYCRRQIIEDAERCPYCERYITEEDRQQSQKPWWLYAGVAICLVIVYFWVVGW